MKSAGDGGSCCAPTTSCCSGTSCAGDSGAQDPAKAAGENLAKTDLNEYVGMLNYLPSVERSKEWMFRLLTDCLARLPPTIGSYKIYAVKN